MGFFFVGYYCIYIRYIIHNRRQIVSNLEKRRQAALEQLLAIGTARRGQLSEQYYERTDRQGKVHRRGPYYVWQRWVHGQKQSVRVPPAVVDRVRADLKRGRKVAEIFDELWAVME